MGNDNTTSHSSQEYDGGVKSTIPFYSILHQETIHLVRHSQIEPFNWLDTGCGTGSLVKECLLQFPRTHFTLADPSAEMLSVAREKLKPAGSRTEFITGGSETLSLPDGSFDVITGVLAHHYLDEAGRRRAVENCRRMLREGGILITIEHVSAFDERGKQIALKRWSDYQVSAGKDSEESKRYLSGYDKRFFPITAEQHLTLMRECGFKTTEIFWYAYAQIGLYAIK